MTYKAEPVQIFNPLPKEIMDAGDVRKERQEVAKKLRAVINGFKFIKGRGEALRWYSEFNGLVTELEVNSK